MYVPMLWALFSKRHTGYTVLGVTLVSLSVNAFFKWNGVYNLNQAEAQALGVLLPLFLMAAYELNTMRKMTETQQYRDYESSRLARIQTEAESEDRIEDERESDRENKHGIRVIGIGILATGCLIAGLGGISDVGRFLVVCVGVCVAIAGISVLRGNRKNPSGAV